MPVAILCFLESKKKGPASRAFHASGRKPAEAVSDGTDLAGRRTFLALGLFELDLLAFLQRLESGALDVGVVREEVLAAVIRRDESKTLRIVEPLDGAFCHLCNVP